MNTPSGIKSSALLELMRKVRERNAAAEGGVSAIIPAPINTIAESIQSAGVGNFSGTNQYGATITYNDEQQEFINLAVAGSSAVLLGPAGTGKTTCQKGAIAALISSGRIPTISDTYGHKYLVQGAPGIILTSFTRRAVRNLKRAVSSDLESNCITLHKLLEYQPVYYEIYDEEADKYKTTMRFEPTRNSQNPLPQSIKVVIFDESSMISVALFEQLCNALMHNVQFLFVGDIQQLPPVFGPAILGYKATELPVIQLDKVYRQAMESPIIALATSIRRGETQQLLTERLVTRNDEIKSSVTLHPWKKKLHAEVALLTCAKFFKEAYNSGAYNPDEDQILIPFNKSFGTDELNKHIAQHIARCKQRLVHEIVAGYNKHYYAVGDLVLFDKEDAEIISISKNGTYIGKRAQPASLTLDYWGHDSERNGASAKQIEAELDDVDMDKYLDAIAAVADGEDKTNTASHVITVRMIDSEEEVSIDSAADVNNLLLKYALTVHKSQGSEWDKVFVIFHQSHNTMIQRELLYTAITSAAKELYVICEPDSFQKGVASQKIKGTTLEEKLEFFKGKKLQNSE